MLPDCLGNTAGGAGMVLNGGGSDLNGGDCGGRGTFPVCDAPLTRGGGESSERDCGRNDGSGGADGGIDERGHGDWDE